MISIRVAPTQYLGKVVPSIRPYPSGIFDLNMACWTIHKDSPEKEVPGYPHFSSIYTLCFFHYKPTSYWASPIYGNPHLVRCFFSSYDPPLIDRNSSCLPRIPRPAWCWDRWFLARGFHPERLLPWYVSKTESHSGGLGFRFPWIFPYHFRMSHLFFCGIINRDGWKWPFIVSFPINSMVELSIAM